MTKTKDNSAINDKLNNGSSNIKPINLENDSETLTEYILNHEIADYILSHDALSKQKERAETGSNNDFFFRKDFENHLLDKYKGTSVLYWKGIMCGQSKDGRKLWQKASSYYGQSNLTVFLVPQSLEELNHALGYSIKE
jgi:hypothetical protein